MKIIFIFYCFISLSLQAESLSVFDSVYADFLLKKTMEISEPLLISKNIFNSLKSNAVIYSIPDSLSEFLRISKIQEDNSYIIKYILSKKDSISFINYIDYLQESSIYINKCYSNVLFVKNNKISKILQSNSSNQSLVSLISLWQQLQISNYFSYFELYNDSTKFSYIDYLNTKNLLGNGIHYHKIIQTTINKYRLYYLNCNSIFSRVADDSLHISFTIFNCPDDTVYYYVYDKINISLYKNVKKYDVISENHSISKISKRILWGEDWGNYPIAIKDKITSADLSNIKIDYDSWMLSKTNCSNIDSVINILFSVLNGRKISGISIPLSLICRELDRIPNLPPEININPSLKNKVIEAYIRGWNKINNKDKPELYFEDIAPPVINRLNIH